MASTMRLDKRHRASARHNEEKNKGDHVTGRLLCFGWSDERAMKVSRGVYLAACLQYILAAQGWLSKDAGTHC